MISRLNITKTVAFRLFLSLFVIFLVVFSLFAYVSVKNYQKHSMELAEVSISRISDIIRRSTRYGMMLKRNEDVHEIIKTVGGQKGIVGVKIYNKFGEIIFSDKSSELLQKTEVTSPQCSPCHNNNQALRNLSEKDRVRSFLTADNKKVIGLITPIKNEPDCATASCHAHPPEAEILGVLDVQLSTETIDAIVKDEINQMIIMLSSITMIISLFAGIFIFIMVRKPVNKLYLGTNELSLGNLSYKINYNRKDEFGILADSFNEMSEQLSKAYNEIKDWNDNLNEKVEEKTNQLKEIYNQVINIEKIASLGKLSSTVAHELNNPLEGILTYSKLIHKKLKNSDSPEISKILVYLELISSESARCGEIVKNLLMFSRSSEKNIEPNDLVAIIDRSILLINHHLEIHNIKLEKDYKKDYFEINCDRNQIHQAMVALMINAVEAIGNNGNIIITIAENDNQAIIKVKDTGCGIAKEQMDKIFEPFYTTKEGVKGLGLGLSVVYGIIKQHKGDIKVESEINKGTTIIIELPKNLEKN